MNHLRMNISNLNHAIPYALNNFPFKVSSVSESKNIDVPDLVEVKVKPAGVFESKED